MILAIYVAAAVLPALILLCLVEKQDRVEKEPWGLLGRLVVGGVLAALLAVVLEHISSRLFARLVDPRNPHYAMLFAFLVIAAAEEGAKFFILRRRTWRAPDFNYRFDAIVYSVCVSLGFAAFENISYVFDYGLRVAPIRAILAIPGHASFAVFMGYFYGRAKLWEGRGDRTRARRNLLYGYLAAVFFHGFYDTCALIGTGRANAVFLVFVVVMYALVFRLVRRESRTDVPV